MRRLVLVEVASSDRPMALTRTRWSPSEVHSSSAGPPVKAADRQAGRATHADLDRVLPLGAERWRAVEHSEAIMGFEYQTRHAEWSRNLGPHPRWLAPFPGWWWFATTGEHVDFESWLERDVVMALDFDRAVVDLSAQPS